MFEINHQKVLAISKKEFMDNVRNKWVLALSMIFLLLVILISSAALPAEAVSNSKGSRLPSTACRP
jgi:hypothetical protein